MPRSKDIRPIRYRSGKIPVNWSSLSIPRSIRGVRRTINVRPADQRTPTLMICFTLASILTVIPVGSLAAREPVPEETVVTFVRDHLPRISGSVVQADTRGIFVELDGPPRRLRVAVFRRSVRDADGERRLRRRELGRGDLIPAGDRLARLRADTALLSRVRVGDRVRWTVDPLWLVGEDGVEDTSLKRRLATLEGVERVRYLASDGGTSARPEEGDVVLRFESESIVLRRVGELGELGRTTRYRTPEEAAPEARPSGPSLEKAARFKRRVYDFDWVRVQGGANVRVLVLGGNNTLGLARWEEGPRRMHWHTLTGKVLSVGVLDRRARKLKALPILLVTKQQRDVKSHLYHYDLVDRELTHRWTASRIWMRVVGDSVVAQTLGMNQVFDGSIYPIEVRKDAWSWGEEPAPDFADCPRLPACRPLAGDLLSLSPNGRLDLIGEDRRARAGGTFGGSPVWISPPRSERRVDLPPQYAGWLPGDGTSSVLVPHNRYSGTGIIRAMRSFDEATLHLLSVREGEFEERWQSERQSGYFTGVRGGPADPWAALVNPETYHTTLYRIEGTGYPGW